MSRRQPRDSQGSEGSEVHPPEFRGQDENGNVRPADVRYLTEEQAAALEAYKAEQEAQR